MKKSIILRGLLGFPLGVVIAYVITIIISLAIGDGYFYAVAPELIETCGTEIAAVCLQFILSGILGVAFAAGSAIWENDNWSLLKQTVIHFIITSLAMLPIAYISKWMPQSLLGLAIYFGIFVLIYVIIWIIQYSIWKKKIKQVNDRLHETTNQ